MKNVLNFKTILRIVGIIALAAVIGFTMVSCGGDDGGDEIGHDSRLILEEGYAWVRTMFLDRGYIFHADGQCDYINKESSSSPWKVTSSTEWSTSGDTIYFGDPATTPSKHKYTVTGDTFTWTDSELGSAEFKKTAIGKITGGTSSSGSDVVTFSKIYTDMVVIHSTGSPNTETLDFSYLNSGALSTMGTGDWEAKVTGGTLSLKLGTPSTTKLTSLQESSLTVSDRQAKFAMLDTFYTANNGQRKRLAYCSQDIITIGSQSVPRQAVVFFYVDRDITVNGTDSAGDTTAIYSNLQLKKGWNTVIQSITVSGSHGTGTYTVGTPDNNLKWRIN